MRRQRGAPPSAPTDHCQGPLLLLLLLPLAPQLLLPPLAPPPEPQPPSRHSHAMVGRNPDTASALMSSNCAHKVLNNQPTRVMLRRRVERVPTRIPALSQVRCIVGGKAPRLQRHIFARSGHGGGGASANLRRHIVDGVWPRLDRIGHTA